MTFSVSTPLEYIDALFGSLPNNEKSYQETLQKLAEKVVEDFLAVNHFQVPSLNNKKNLKQFSLARFRCMIQDMKEPEILPSCMRNESAMTTHGFFRDYVEWPADVQYSADQTYITRHVFVCVPIPSETSWVKQMWHELEENNGLTNNYDHNSEDCLRLNTKRQLEDAESIDSQNDRASSKRQNMTKETVTGEALIVPDESCIVKVYTDGDTYKVNDCVEFVGVWNHTEMESEVYCSLHAICAKRLPHSHPNLLVSSQEADLAIRTKLVDHLQSMLYGDRLAADYLLCLLVSSVIRKDIMCIGKCALNLYNIPENESSVFVSRVENSLCDLFSKVQYLPLSLSLLNKERFVPYKNYETNALCTGRLQLSAGTLLIIDETKLQTGQLNEQGVKNIAALKTLILHQRVDYDFVYHSLEFKSDVAVLILSEGPSCLPSDYALPIRKAKDATVVQDIDGISLNYLRSYLIRARRTDLQISEKTQSKIQNDFVEMRRQDNCVNEANLHRLLVLSRWIMCSFGSAVLEEEHWERAKSMEDDRSKRKLL